MEQDITWKDTIVQKLTSRKLWAAIASFVSMLIVALGGAEKTATQITALILAGASVIAYIVGEGLIDASAAKANAQQLPPAPIADEDHPPDEEDENWG